MTVLDDIIGRNSELEAENAQLRAALRRVAYRTVVRVRGSNDVPAFDLCVESELINLLKAE
jgi:hypothetical protein